MRKNRKISLQALKINLALSLSIALMIFSFSFSVPRARAIPVVEVGGNLFTDIVTTVEQTASTVLDQVDLPMDIKDLIQKFIDRYAMPAMKKAAITLSNNITQNKLATGNNGGAQFVQDPYDYLYIQPAKKASVYMNSFFDQTTRGMNSSYSNYMVSQARQELSGVSCDVMNIQNYASNPNQLFADGNMRGLMAFMQPCGNPYSYSAIVQSTYQTKYAQAYDINKSVTSNGLWLPKMENGQITVPANLYSSAMEGSDQMGNNMIVGAQTWNELAVAAAFRMGASLLQYQFGSAKGNDSYYNLANNGYSFVQKAYSSN